MRHKRYIRGPLFLLKMIIILAITGAIVMLLWNALIPELFSGPAINYWQSLGLLLLAKILFGTFGKGYGRNRHHYTGEIWKQKLREKYEAMTPEEKEKFRSRCKTSFSFAVADDAEPAAPAAKADTKDIKN